MPMLPIPVISYAHDAVYFSIINPNFAGEWTGGRELKIHLGYEAYVVPDASGTASNSTAPCQELFSCITLLDGGVRTEAFAVLSSSGSAPVRAPERPPAVTATLVAPQVGAVVDKRV